jgi:hypothetical protein
MIPNCSSKAVFFRVSAFLLWLLIVWDGVSVPLAIAAATHDQTAQDARPFESSMRQHYDAAFRFQGAGDLAQAGMQYELFLADALHELGNGRATSESMLGRYRCMRTQSGSPPRISSCIWTMPGRLLMEEIRRRPEFLLRTR